MVLGNGPSLRGLLDGGRGGLRGRDLLAVNFAGRTVEFFDLRPGLYVLADPVFSVIRVTGMCWGCVRLWVVWTGICGCLCRGVWMLRPMRAMGV